MSDFKQREQHTHTTYNGALAMVIFILMLLLGAACLFFVSTCSRWGVL